MYINCFTRIIFFHDNIYHTKIEANNNSPNSLNVMVNYHYHEKNRVITHKLLSIEYGKDNYSPE